MKRAPPKARPIRLFVENGRYYIIQKGKRKYLQLNKKFNSILTAQKFVAKKLRGRMRRPPAIRQEKPVDKTNELLSKTLTITRLNDLKQKLIKDKESLLERRKLLERRFDDADPKEKTKIKNEIEAIPYALNRADVILREIDQAQTATLSVGLSEDDRKLIKPYDDVKQSMSAKVIELPPLSMKLPQIPNVPRLPKLKPPPKLPPRLPRPVEIPHLPEQPRVPQTPPLEEKKREEKHQELTDIDQELIAGAKEYMVPPGKMSLDEFLQSLEKTGSSLRKRTGPALWSDEIEDYFKGNPEFAGVFSVDEMKYLPKKELPFGFVVNMSKADEPGTHWCSVWITPDSIEYYDPTGEDPPDILVKGIKKKLNEWQIPILMKFKVNKVKGQNNSTNNCGYFAIRFLDERMAGKSFAAATRFESDGVVNMQKSGEAAIKKEFKLI